MGNTAEKIEGDLCLGGEWVLLAAWLGWYWYEVGEKEKAWRLRHWIEAQADEHGWLPEQVPLGLNDESMYAPWVQRWGSIASPLLWSHAEYLILCKCIQDDRSLDGAYRVCLCIPYLMGNASDDGSLSK